jgi:HAE1 family hydrophobic/amphiphilic exporter-1
MSLSQRVVRRPVLGLVIFVLIAIVALYMVSDVTIDLFPEMTNPILTVSTSYSGAGPETVEKAVTRLMESTLVNLGGLVNITSSSSEGSSQVRLEFEFGADLDAKTNDIRDRLDRVRNRLPDGAGSPQIMQYDPNSMPIMRIAVQGDRSQDELRSVAESLIQVRLEQIDGVAAADVMGGRQRQVQITVSQNRLEAYGLTITTLASSLARQNLELGAGSVIDGTRNYSIRTTGEYTSLQDIAETVVTRRNGADIRLQDVGEVSFGYPNETSTVYINGQVGVYLGITKQSGANSVVVADRVYQRLEELKDGLPEDLSLTVTQDSTTMIRDMINELVKSAVTGAILAMVILFLFLRNIKSTIIIGISIPFSILVTLMIMSLAKITLNMLTMAGLILGVGMIVDNSIVILENIFKFRERGSRPEVAAELGTHEVLSSIISSTLTTLCVFVPIFLFKNRLGQQGQLYQGLILTVGISLTASLMIAVFLVPILSSKYLALQTRSQKPLKNPLLRGLDRFFEGTLEFVNRGYRRLLTAGIYHRILVLILVAAALGGAIWAVPRLGLSFMPPANEDSVSLRVNMPQGTRYEITKEVMLQLQDFALEEIRGIETLMVNIGGGGGGRNSHQGNLNLSLDLNNPEADTAQSAMNKLRSRFGDFPNARMTFGQGNFRMAMGSSGDIDLSLRIDDIDEGLAAAGEIVELLETIPEITDVSLDLDEGLPEVEVVIDRSRAYDLGLSVRDIAAEISAAMNGVTATTFRYSGEEYNVNLILREEDRERLPDLERIFVASSTAGLVPLSNFASLKKGLGPVTIRRENQSRMIHITASLASGTRADWAESRVRQVVGENFVIPETMNLTYGGQWEEITETTRTFVLIFTLAVLLVFGVMAGQYESFKDPLINLCTIPLMVIGIVLIHVFVGQQLSMFTLVGAVMLAGIVVNNGIILVDYTNLLARRGVAIREACIEAASSRLRPVLMTTLTTILGLIPMAFFPAPPR